MRIAVHGKKLDQALITAAPQIFALFEKYQLEIIVLDKFQKQLKKNGVSINYATYTKKTGLEGIDFMLTLGGDGTILNALTYIGNLEIPIIGVNVGRLGFLATIGLDQIEYALEQLRHQKFRIDKRSLLRLEDPEDLFDGAPYALNDFTILKSDSSSMIVVHTYVDDAFLNSYWSDGLIISTPTGSTGYSLSCGGPIVVPHSNSFIINPVSPHNLNVRPLVVDDGSVLSFKIDTRTDNVLLTLDSRSVTVPASTELTVKKESFSACLVIFEGYHPFETLRQKLFWGQDARN